jgi:hypothetical protein
MLYREKPKEYRARGQIRGKEKRQMFFSDSKEGQTYHGTPRERDRQDIRLSKGTGQTYQGT